MAQNRGKQFENIIKMEFESISGVSIDRLHDQTTGFRGSQNICDFIVYKKPYEYYIECKSVHGNTFPFSNITDRQYYGLLDKSQIKGVFAGVIVWWIDKDRTLYIPIQTIKSMKECGGKSIASTINCEVGIIEIPFEKKRVFCKYDMDYFFHTIEKINRREV